MAYIDGFVAAVPAGRRQDYIDHANRATPLFAEFGAVRCVDAWGEDVPDGKLTDFKGAVQAQDGEVVVFGWFEHPSREVRDGVHQRMGSDPRMEALGEMPFDGKRMIFGGFRPIVDLGKPVANAFVDGFLLAVPESGEAAYTAIARTAAEVFIDHGAARVVEAWDDDVPEGRLTDMRRAVKAEAGEKIVFSWIEWPDRATRDAGMKSSMADPRMKMEHEKIPFDGKRVVFGGFQVVAEG